MPVFVNDNAHTAYVGTDPNLKQIAAGAAVEVPESDAAEYEVAANTPGSGVRLVTGDEASKALAATTASRTPDPSASELSPGLAAVEKLAQRVSQIVHDTVVAEGNKIVGDDQAPYGPPSGTTVSTQEQAAKSAVDRKQFAPGEALPGETVTTPQLPSPTGDKTGDEVHNEQVAAAERTAQTVAEQLGALKADEAAEEAVESEPTPPPTPPSTPSTPSTPPVTP